MIGARHRRDRRHRPGRGALLTARGDTVLAVGTDAARLETVDAAERLVATSPTAPRPMPSPLTSRRATTASTASCISSAAGSRGWSDEVTDWLNLRLVTTLLNVSEAFEAAAAGGAGRTPRDHQLDSGHARWPAVVGLRRREARRRVVGGAAELALGRATNGGAVTFVVRSIGDGDKASDAAYGGRRTRRRRGLRQPGARVLL